MVKRSSEDLPSPKRQNEHQDHLDTSSDSSSESSFDENEEIVDDMQTVDDEQPDTDQQDLQTSFEAWNPSIGLEEDEKLEVDTSAYHLLHNLSTPWPCYSLAFIPDNLGVRTSFPLTTTLVAGTQAENDNQNSLFLLKCHNIRSTLYDGDSENEQDDASDDEFKGEAQLKSVEIPHFGAVNKLSTLPGNGSVLATTSSDAITRIFNISEHLSYLDQGGVVPPTQPVYESQRAKDEGYGLDWSIGSTVSLFSSSCSGHVQQHLVTGSGVVGGRRWQAHSESVEGISVCPVDPSLFCTCSTDGKIKLWNVNSLKKPCQTFKVSNTDVNCVAYLGDGVHLVTGDDDGVVKVFDTRNVSDSVFEFSWHRTPITSLSRAPSTVGYDDWLLGVTVCSDDGSVTTWDFSVDGEGEKGIPAQLLFYHFDNCSVKDSCWHPQVPGLFGSTHANGLTLYKPRYLFDEEAMIE
ncbi:hypothetical protein P9112_002635 [Eukaryota sp. TZLM1-RC]